MKYRIAVSVTLLLLVAAAVFGVVKRQTYTDIVQKNNMLDELEVAELPENLVLQECERMEKELPDVPFILRVQVADEIEYLFGASRQKVQVQEVYSGENLKAGDEIYITGRCSLDVTSELKTVECDFINIPRIGYEYLIFAEAQVDTLYEEIPVYSLYNASFIAPVFCYEDFPHVIVPTEGETTYVPYVQVKDNEFFAESELGFQTWNELKCRMLAMYPMK